MTKQNKIVPRNSDQYEQLASEYIIKRTPELDTAAKNAHALYNCALYQLRQSFIKRRKWLNCNQLDTIFKTKYRNRENMLYHALPYVQSAQQTLRESATNWQAWIKALNAYRVCPGKFSGRPRMPKYLKQGQRHTFYVTNQSAKIKDGYLVIPRLKFKLQLIPGITKIGRVSFKPLAYGYKVIVPYKTELTIKYLEDNEKYLGIDPGVDNSFACATNNGQRPLLINGRALKSVNQYYNKERARLKKLQAQYHQLEKVINTKQGPKPIYQETHAIQHLTNWRNTKIKQFAHKASKRIVEYALNCGTNTIIIGKTKSWKRSANMGKKNNQNFIGIPHQIMINMIKYKANLVGITVIQTNESYTSQTSALDHEMPCWNNGNVSRKHQGKSPNTRRIKRGLFKANDGTLINADVNGALQIIKKVFPKFSFDEGIADVVLRPVKWSPLI